MKNLLILLFAITAFSALAEDSVLARVTNIVASYTPISSARLLASDKLANMPIVNRFVARELMENLNQDLVEEFGNCAQKAMSVRSEMSILELTDSIMNQCNL